MNWHTLREIDEGLGLPKGSAFRAFKSLALVEEADFRVLHPDREPTAFQALHRAGRIYPGTQRALLLGDTARRQVEAILMAGPAET
ncbi:MAG: hypothetical protein ACOY5H_05590 [Pseudomonadota bacterium]